MMNIHNTRLVKATKRTSAAAALAAVTLFASLATTQTAVADRYVVDTKGAHAFVQFRVKHLGYSWLYGRFNSFEGEFTYDPKKPEASTIEMEVDVTSVDTNHALRESHIAEKKYLNSKKHPTASFKSTAYKVTGEGLGELTGDLTFLGVTKPITIEVEHIGGGKDPWGGYRQGFEGRATMTAKDWGLDLGEKLGASSATVELMLSIEGIKQ